MSRSLVIFDWDGTLMDSTARIVACMQQAAEDAGLVPLPALQVRQIIGLGLPEAIRTLYPLLSHGEVEVMRQRYAVHFLAAEVTPCALFPGVREVLDILSGAGVRMAVATGKSRKGLNRVWANSGLGHYFVSSRCADETRSKPAPDMVHELLAEQEVAPEQALVVGDTSFDLQMARDAGVDRVGVTYGAHASEILAAFSPLALCDHIADLLPLLKLTSTEIA